VATLENLQDARTAVELAGAAVRIAEFNQRFAVIVAPDDGQILRRRGEPGELVAAGQTMVSFASDAEGWIVRAGLADRELAQVRIGNRVEIVAGDSAPVWGRLAQIAEAADPATRTTPVEIMLDTVPMQARSGMVAVATVVPERVAPRPMVPASALIEGEGTTASLFVIDDGGATARRMAVEIEALHGDQAFLRTAIPRASRLVVSGGEYLRDGMAVEIEALRGDQVFLRTAIPHASRLAVSGGKDLRDGMAVEISQQDGPEARP
jgi:RND family efflux transporter MFP subunit